MAIGGRMSVSVEDGVRGSPRKRNSWSAVVSRQYNNAMRRNRLTCCVRCCVRPDPAVVVVVGRPHRHAYHAEFIASQMVLTILDLGSALLQEPPAIVLMIAKRPRGGILCSSDVIVKQSQSWKGI
jgi:hypothetical protein